MKIVPRILKIREITVQMHFEDSVGKRVRSVAWLPDRIVSKSKNNFRDFGEGYFHDQYHTQQDLNNVDA